MKVRLAINGGAPILKRPLPPTYNIGDTEIKAVIRLMKKGPLSDFVGAPGDYFLGGCAVRALEKSFCKKFGVKYAVSFNSATTALHAAVVALGIGPGDEVIVPPYSMSASVTAILMNGAVPVFADVEDRTFCLDIESVKKNITKYTKAMMVVNLFGGPANFKEVLKIAKKNNLRIIEDNAQSPGAKYNGKFTGTIGDIGVFSFNVHKVIQSGEGGVLVTNSKKYAFRAQMARNHGENLTGKGGNYNFGPIIGSNYRMTEIEAVIASEQLKKLNFLNRERIKLVNYLSTKLKNIEGITVPFVEKFNHHVFYVYPIKIDEKRFGLSRDLFVKAMMAEGFPMSKGYVEPFYLLPVFQNKQVFNYTHFPFDYHKRFVSYKKGICPVAERLYEKEFTFTNICQYPHTRKEIDLFVRAVLKVVKNKKEIYSKL